MAKADCRHLYNRDELNIIGTLAFINKYSKVNKITHLAGLNFQAGSFWQLAKPSAII
jgi:hypothetical protein